MCVRWGKRDEQCLIALTLNLNGPNPPEMCVTTHSPSPRLGFIDNMENKRLVNMVHVYLLLFSWTPQIRVVLLLLHLFPHVFLSVADFPGFSSALVFPLLLPRFLPQVYGVTHSSLPTRSVIWVLPVISSSTVCSRVCLVTPVECLTVQEVIYGRKHRLHLWSGLESIPFDILQTKLISDLWTFPSKLMLIEAKL